jgi:ABC-type transport system involved in multi-copper enzyme maturation permease subunit
MSQPGPGGATGIADLTYRNYDGELRPRAARFWTVALSVIRTNVKKPGFWIIGALILLVYFVIGLIFFITKNVAANARGIGGDALTYPVSALSGIDSTLFLLFIATLLIGSGSIAADNKANALLVYLGKPLTKRDYLLGKWVGVFTLLAALSVIPATVLYLFFLASYYSDGFLKEQPQLWWQMLLSSLLAPAINASLITGFSAFSKSPRTAGGTFAAFYLVLQFLMTTAGFLFLRNALLDQDVQVTPDARGAVRAATIQRLSVPGVCSGLAMNLLRVDPTRMMMGGPRRFRDRVKRPEPLPLALLGLAFIVVPLALARTKINAVEVVKG